MTTDAEHRETARAIEIILSGIRLDNETARILKSHLKTQREMFNDRPTGETMMTDQLKETGMTWRTDEPPKDGTIIYRRVWSVFRYQPYKPNSQQYKRGEKGRWQEMNEYGGWDNCGNHPIGNEWRYEAPEINHDQYPHRDADTV